MNPLTFEKPLVMGHRGFQTHFPENTLVSFMAAVKAGAQYVELDVTLTDDRQLVVIHDNTVDRTTNGTGFVQDYTLKELQQLDAGSWFDPRFAGERIPALNEVFEHLSGKTGINLEIKSHDLTNGVKSGDIEEAVVDLVNMRKKQYCVLVSSFDPTVLKNIRQCNPDIGVAFISKFFRQTETPALCRELQVFSYHPNLKYLDEEQVKMMHREGIYVFPYNINNEDDIHRAFTLGVDGLIAKNPQLARECYFASRLQVQNQKRQAQ